MTESLNRPPATRQPLVALETSVIAQGLPCPINLEVAERMEAIIREEGAVPRTTAFISGQPVAGIDGPTIARFAESDGLLKAGLADLPVIHARGLDAATTVATASWIAHRAGIGVLVTGGIGGIHRRIDGLPSSDISGDLTALSQTPVTVVCSGPKAILHLEATREALETFGITVVGFGTDRMPAFWFADSDLPVDVRCDTPREVADLVRSRDALMIRGALLVCVPVPPHAAVEPRIAGIAIDRAIREAVDVGMQSGFVTPFLLARLRDVAGGALLRANRALLENNARVAARIAIALVPPPEYTA